MVRFIEVSKHELEHGPEPILARFLWHCYKMFRLDNPTSILGDNIVIMYSNDFYELKTKAEAYERMVSNAK